MSDEDDPKFVLDDVCKARMDAMMAWVRALFASSLITIALIIIQLVRGT